MRRRSLGAAAPGALAQGSDAKAILKAILAFRNFDTDWQLWVEVGKAPIPRKLVITSKTLNSAPQYTLRIKTWKTDVRPADDAFAFAPPAGARKLDPNDLGSLDELPPSAPTGEKR